MLDDDLKTKRLIIFFAIVTIIILAILLIYAILKNKTGASKLNSTTGCATPVAPSGVTAVSLQTTKILVNWKVVPGASAYKIYVGTIPGFTIANSFADYTTATNTYTITNLTLGKTYYLFVETIGACGNTSASVSSTVSVTLNFPAKFMIVNQGTPSLALAIAPDFQNIIVDTLCSGSAGDNHCVWVYNKSTGYIESASTLTNCIKTYPAAIDVRLKYEQCDLQSYYNYASARVWVYKPSDGTLCNPQNPEGINCVQITGNPIAGQNTTRVPFDGTSRMQWNIVEVP